MTKIPHEIYEVKKTVKPYKPAILLKFLDKEQQCAQCGNGYIHEKGWLVWYRDAQFFVCKECCFTPEEAYAKMNFPGKVLMTAEFIERYRKAKGA